VIFKLRGSEKRREYIMKNLDELSDFLNSDWELILNSEKFNL
jgi:hypothetical protein